MHILQIPAWFPSCKEDLKGSFFREQALMFGDVGLRVGVLHLNLRSLKASRNFVSRHGIDFEIDGDLNIVRVNGCRYFAWNSRLNVWYWSRVAVLGYQKYIEKYGVPDCIHVQSSIYSAICARAIKRKFGVKYIITEHSSEFVRGIAREDLRSILGRSFEDASALISVSEYLASNVNRSLGMDFKWRVIGNPVADMFLYPEVPPKMSLAPDFVFISVGTLDDNKNQGRQIEAVRRMRGVGVNCVLKIIGDGPNKIHLENQIDRHELSDRILLLGSLSRQEVLEEMLKKSHVMLVTSNAETFSVVAAEALCLGKPVIATRSGGPSEVLQGFHDSILINVGDIDSLTAAMISMMKKYHLIDSSAIAGMARERFSSSNFVKNYKEVFDEVLD